MQTCNTMKLTVFDYGIDIIGPKSISLLLFPKTNNITLQWRHSGRGSVSNHQPHDCLLNRSFRRRSKKTSKLRVTGLCAGNSPGTGEFPAQWPVTRKMFLFDDVIVKRYCCDFDEAKAVRIKALLIAVRRNGAPSSSETSITPFTVSCTYNARCAVVGVSYYYQRVFRVMLVHEKYRWLIEHLYFRYCWQCTIWNKYMQNIITQNTVKHISDNNMMLVK